MSRSVKDGASVRREDRWPTEADLGSLVILPGGEVGTLRAWWNAQDGSEWRWQFAAGSRSVRTPPRGDALAFG